MNYHSDDNALMIKNLIDIVQKHQPISKCERVMLTAREAFLSATDYHDGKHYGALTDLTGIAALESIRNKMMENETGQVILRQKPRITNDSWRALEELPNQSFGKAYYIFMKGYEFTPEERPTVMYVPDLELAYISQRYKEIHDFLHVLLLDQVNLHNELLIKWFQMIHLGFPSATMAALISPLLSNLTIAEIASIVRKANNHTFIMNIYYEKHFHRPLSQVKKDFSSF